jgi:phosphatidylglycerophosphate synthase
LTLADLFSLVRIPLGVVFLFVASRLPLALTVLAAAALSDVLDGWAARRQRPPADHERHRGDWLDPFCDKVFVAAMLSGIYVVHHPPVKLLVLVVTRELLQSVALAIYKLVPSLRRGPPYNYRAHALGKATTVAQFLTAAALLLDQPLSRPLAVACALLGLATVLVYVNRARAAPASR